MRIIFIRRKQCGICIIFGILLVLFYGFIWKLHNSKVISPPEVVLEDRLKNSHESSFTANGSQTCKIPQLDVFHPDVLQFFKKPEPLNCAQKYSLDWLAWGPNSSLMYTDYAEKTYGSSIRCDLHYIFRKDDFKNHYKIMENYQVGTLIDQADFFIVKCRSGLFRRWSKLFMQVLPDGARIKELEKVIKSEKWSGLDVYFLGFDSLSQMSFRRQLPKTVKFLEEVMGSVILNGYNIVGDGTPQAFIPILTGKTEIELPTTRKRDDNSNFVDVYPWIWNKFAENGYASLYGEDVAFIGTFTYRLKGFQRQPTDHYTRTYFLEAENHLGENIVTCMGEEPIYKLWFKYGEEFMARYPKTVPKFALLHHAALSHDDENMAQLFDNNLHLHLKKLYLKGYFDNALVIVMSDHGNRFAKLRDTEQGFSDFLKLFLGQLEERLPFFSLYLPEKFRNTSKGVMAYENLKKNAQKLTSPFDIYATLRDIMEFPDIEEMQNPPKSRSTSLFREIPEGRSCEQAGIDPHWCTCLAWQSAIASDSDFHFSQILAQSVVGAINNLTSTERDLCAPLSLHKLENSRRFSPHEGVIKYSGVKDEDGFVPDFDENRVKISGIYQLTFITMPGNAKYQTTIRYDSTTNRVFLDLTSISHVNKYGDNPHCILNKNSFLILYCVCYDQI